MELVIQWSPGMAIAELCSNLPRQSSTFCGCVCPDVLLACAASHHPAGLSFLNALALPPPENLAPNAPRNFGPLKIRPAWVGGWLNVNRD